MEIMSILQPPPKTFRELLTAHKTYYVPVYQRPYSWQKEQVEKLWEDIKENGEKENPYFLGILLFRVHKGSDKLEIVDGQQRFATLLLLIKAAVEVIATEDAVKANDIQKEYINKKDPLEENNQLTLKLSKQDREKFEDLLLGKSDGNKKYPSWRLLEESLAYFKEVLTELKKANGINAITKLLSEKIMTLQFIDLQVQEDSDVYLFFETLNDRGIDLSIADLVKNRVCSVAHAQGMSAEEAAARIDDISEKIGYGKMLGFLLHYCLSMADSKDPVPRNRLMDWYGKIIDTQRDTFIKNLGQIANIYSEFVEPKLITLHQDSLKKEVLKDIKALGATRCYPLLIRGAVMFPQKDFIRLCQAVEILTFRHSTIAKKDAKILEGKYFELAKAIRKGEKINLVLSELKKQAEEISDKVFKTNFEEFEPDGKTVARYVLFKIEKFIDKKSALLDWDLLTLEHILAKNASWDGKETLVERIGNLTLLTRKMNREASDKPFKEKKEIYKEEEKIKITRDLLKMEDFTSESLLERQGVFAELACEIWSPNLIV